MHGQRRTRGSSRYAPPQCAQLIEAPPPDRAACSHESQVLRARSEMLGPRHARAEHELKAPAFAALHKPSTMQQVTAIEQHHVSGARLHHAFPGEKRRGLCMVLEQVIAKVR